MSAQSEIERSRKTMQDLQRKIGDQSKKVATARERAARARQSASRSRSATTAASKLREAEREDDKAVKAEADRARLETKLASEQKKLHAAEVRLSKETARKQERAMSELRSSIERGNQQFRPTFENEPPRLPGRPAMGSLSDEMPSPTYDVFISHASEDKEEIGTPLANGLRDAGLRVWFDEFELQVGDSLRRRIDEGLVKSAFGVVILSRHFFAKEWPRVELDGLTARATESGGPLILPIWHHISKQEVLDHSPTLAGVMALNTSVMTIDEIVSALVKRVKPARPASAGDEVDVHPHR